MGLIALILFSGCSDNYQEQLKEEQIIVTCDYESLSGEGYFIDDIFKNETGCYRKIRFIN